MFVQTNGLPEIWNSILTHSTMKQKAKCEAVYESASTYPGHHLLGLRLVCSSWRKSVTAIFPILFPFPETQCDFVIRTIQISNLDLNLQELYLSSTGGVTDSSMSLLTNLISSI